MDVYLYMLYIIIQMCTKIWECSQVQHHRIYKVEIQATPLRHGYKGSLGSLRVKLQPKFTDTLIIVGVSDTIANYLHELSTILQYHLVN